MFMESIPPDWAKGIFEKRNPLEGITAEDAGPENAAALGLPSCAAGLLEDCRTWLQRYMVLSADQANILAAWVLHTWAMDAAECTPYLHVTSPEKGCGKTRLLETLEPIVCRPWLTGRVTAAVLVRKVDKESPTLLLDESDAAFKGAEDYSEALRGILNSGFKRGGTVSLCVGQGANISYKDFSCFAPKAIAGIGKIPDTVASRSIVIELRRKTAGESVAKFRKRDVDAAAKPLRERLERWAASGALEALSAARPMLPDGLSNRQEDISEPLAAIADLAGSEWPERLRRSLVAIFGSAPSEDSSLGVQLLSDIRAAFGTQDRIPSAELACALCEMEGQPWAEWAHGKGMNADRLAKQLKKFSIAPRTIRIGNTTLRGYERSWFEDAWSRYCPIGGSTGATADTSRADIDESAISEVQQRRNVAGEVQHGNPHKQRVVAPVASVAPLQGTRQGEGLFEGMI